MGATKTGLYLDYLIHPGETLYDLLEDRKMTQAELAIRAGVSAKHISEVVNGNASISPKLASALENIFGTTANFWLNLQNNYDIERIKIMSTESVTESELEILNKLKKVMEYLRTLKLLEKGGTKAELVLFFRRFLSVSSLTSIPALSFNAAFRKADNIAVDPYVLYSWIKICEVLSAQKTSSNVLNIEKLRGKVGYIKSLMLLPDINDAISKLAAVFAECGIKFGVIAHITGAPVHGFIEKTDEGDLILFLTIRGKYADKFWFTLFHEIAHILNGDIDASKRFIDYEFLESDVENAANSWASNALLNDQDYRAFILEGEFSLTSIKSFAEKQEVFPGVVIGRLQKEKHIPYSYFNSEKLKYEWAK